MRLENGITIQTLKKMRRGDLSIVVRACLSKRVPSKKNEDSCRWFLPKSHRLPFCVCVVTYSILVCLSFLLINFCLLLTTLYISIAQIHTDELSLSLTLSLSLSVLVRVLLLRR